MGLSITLVPRDLLTLLRSIPPSQLAAIALSVLVALTASVGSLSRLLVFLIRPQFYLLISLVAHHPRPPTDSEKLYLTTTPAGDPSHPLVLPGTFATDSKPGLDLSVIVPAYNESSRLPSMLSDAVQHLHTTRLSWEILIVDDGSRDETSQTALAWTCPCGKPHPDAIRVVKLSQNRGKGGAVAHGMRHFRGRYAVFADADGATKFADIDKLMDEIPMTKDGYGIAVGSRAHMVHTDAVVKRSFVRNFLMYSFHTLLRTVGVSWIEDTQCGFKLFSREAAKAVFRDLRTERWIFDIEILLLAKYKGIPVVEVPVSWHEVEGTKMSLVSDSVRMAWDLGVVRAGYALGVYTVGPAGPKLR